jgi:hypothetical protein
MSTASFTRTINHPTGFKLNTTFIGPAVGGDHKIGVRKNPTWITDGMRDLRSRRQSVKRAKSAIGNMRATGTSIVSGISKRIFQVIL